jgi:hypothetical protein
MSIKRIIFNLFIVFVLACAVYVLGKSYLYVDREILGSRGKFEPLVEVHFWLLHIQIMIFAIIGVIGKILLDLTKHANWIRRLRIWAENFFPNRPNIDNVAVYKKAAENVARLLLAVLLLIAAFQVSHVTLSVSPEDAIGFPQGALNRVSELFLPSIVIALISFVITPRN